MKLPPKAKAELDKRFQKVLQTPASYGLFVAIHDFVKHIEASPALLSGLSDRIKINKELDISGKYDYLKKIYQGLEDIGRKSSSDLGHSRYAIILELNRIQKNDVSDSNSFWKKRELSRKLAATIYERLNVQLC